MALNIAHEPDTVLLPARRPDLVIGAVFTETPLVGRDATIKLKSCSRADVIQRSIVSDEASGKKPKYGGQIARGAVVCPVKALQEWLEAAGISSGPVFRAVSKSGGVAEAGLSDRSVANIVKAMVGAVGLDATAFSGHSLRSGFLTSAATSGANIFKMMDVSRHKSVDSLTGLS